VVQVVQGQPLALLGHLSLVLAVEEELDTHSQAQEQAVRVAPGAAGLDQISHRLAAAQVV
jgi:hypothetical protein